MKEVLYFCRKPDYRVECITNLPYCNIELIKKFHIVYTNKEDAEKESIWRRGSEGYIYDCRNKFFNRQCCKEYGYTQ